MANMTSPNTNPRLTKLPPLGSYLFTPPDPIHDSFSTGSIATAQEKSVTQWQPIQQNKLAPLQSAVPSPPTTPETRVFENLPTDNSSWQGSDRQLFPDSAAREGPNANTPLFETESVHNSPQQASAQLRQSPQPIEPEIGIATNITTDISETNNWGKRIGPTLFIENNRHAKRAWYETQLAELDYIKSARAAAARLPHPVKCSSPRDPYTTSLLRQVEKPTGITKTRSPPKVQAKPHLKPKAPKATSSTPKAAAPAPARRTPKARTVFEFVDAAFPQANQSTTKHKRAAPTKKVDKGDDRDWKDVPDYSPPISSLKTAPKPLKANWKASHTPWDISHSPDVEFLDPAEYGVCETLRLFPVQYLANKRRMFQTKVETLKENGKNFNKTAAQLACNMDVNKASQMWEAFDRVGWFDRHWFEKYL